MRARTSLSTLTLASLIGGLGVLALHTTLGLGGQRFNWLFDDDVYNVLMFGATLVVIARGVLVREQRGAWLTMGAGMLSWSVGELYYSLFIEGTGAEAGGSVSLADAFFLTMYPCFYVAFGLLVKDHLRDLRIGIWLDGLIAGLAAATVSAALILPPVLDHATGNVGSLVVSLAYPVGDILLMMFAIGAIAITGWRPSSVWALIAAGMFVSAVADSVYLYETGTRTFSSGTWLECLWPVAAILIAIAAWTPAARSERRRMKSWQMVSVPTLALLSSLGVLVYGNLGPQLTLPALILAAATVLAVGVHLIYTLRENLALLANSRHLSLTDPLTGLGNRRRLMGDLRLACSTASPHEPWELVLYDLDGFKLYNDAFGHPAGDTLLVRLSDRLRSAVEPYGTAYRMGGDEFCVLFDRTDACDASIDEQASVAALAEHGPGFSITASHGVVQIPSEVSDPASIMQLADQRLYRRKEEAAARRRSIALSVNAETATTLETAEIPVTTTIPTTSAIPRLTATPRTGMTPGTTVRSEANAAPTVLERSGDVEHGEDALALGEHNRSLLAGTTSKQGASDRRVRRQPPF
jgi:two-component system cell cycle response regulator